MSLRNPLEDSGQYVSNLSKDRIAMLRALRNTKCVSELSNMIYNFPNELIIEALEENLGVRQYAEAHGINCSKYIGELRDYQTVGSAFLYTNPRCMIADGCGLGKTAEVAGLLNMLEQKKELKGFIIAVENSAYSQTIYEMCKFTGLNIIGAPSETSKFNRWLVKTDLRKVDGIVIKHSALKMDAFNLFLAKNSREINGKYKCTLFNTFILDESSVIKNNKTKTYDYTYNICRLADRVVFMNATVFETKLLDIYYQLDMLDDNLLPKEWRINDEYCTHKRTSYWTRTKGGKPEQHFRFERAGYKNQEKFKEKIQLSYFGRKRSELGLVLPHIYKVYEVEMSDKQKKALATGQYRYNELLNCPSLTDSGIEFNRSENPKLNRVCELLESDLSDSRVMIYCFHIEAQKKLKEEIEKLGKKAVILNGEVNNEIERYNIQTDFNEGKYDVIITNIKRSLNLNGADACVLYSLETNIAKMEQIRGRIDRNVDDSIKTFILLLYKDSGEEDFFKEKVMTRAKDSRAFTLDEKTAADFFGEVI